MNTKPRLLITSLPKSGTHLLGNVLKSMTKQQEVHWVHYNRGNGKYIVSLSRDCFGGNRDEWLNFLPGYPYAYFTGQEFDNPQVLLNIIRNGEYAFSHLSRNQFPTILDNSFIYLVTVRNIEGIVASAFNAEAKIVREQPFKRDGLYQSLNLADPNEEDIVNFLNLYFDRLVPHVLDLLYWRFSTQSIFLSFDDLSHRSEKFLRFARYMAGRLNVEWSSENLDDSLNHSATKVTASEKVISPEDVLKILGENEILRGLNQNIEEALKERSVYV